MSDKLDALRDLGALAVSRPTLPDGFTCSASGEDDAEMCALESSGRDGIDGWVICIEYEDAKGNLSTRDIECRALVPSAGFEHLRAFCFVRERLRSFRLDRIRSVTDYDTGEIFQPPGSFLKLLRQLAGHGNERSNLTKFAAEFGAETKVLVFLGRASGKFVRAEEDAILEFLRKNLSVRESISEIEPQLRTWVRSLYPSAECVADALAEMKKDGRVTRQFLDLMKNVLLADGEFQDTERLALRAVGKLVEDS